MYNEYFNSHIADRCPLASRNGNNVFTLLLPYPPPPPPPPPPLGWTNKRSVNCLQWHNQWVNTGLIVNSEGTKGWRLRDGRGFINVHCWALIRKGSGDKSVGQVSSDVGKWSITDIWINGIHL